MMTDDEIRYHNALHAMQSGVAAKMPLEGHETEPKHLRVGVNSALVSQAALVKLLVEKKLITKNEFMRFLADEMEAEVERYKIWLSKKLGTDVIDLK